MVIAKCVLNTAQTYIHMLKNIYQICKFTWTSLFYLAAYKIRLQKDWRWHWGSHTSKPKYKIGQKYRERQ